MSDNNAVAKRGAKPQPPEGHVSLRMLCHESAIGGIIGKSGSSIKHLQFDTGSRIRVEDSLQLGAEHRVIVIVAPTVPFRKMKLRNSYNEVEFEVSAAQEAALRVFERILEVSGEEENTVILCRLLVETSEAGSVIGKGGNVVKKIRRESGGKIRVLSGGKLPIGVSYPDEVVEIEGSVLAVKKALLGVCGQLQECTQAESLSFKERKPLESTSQSLVNGFYDCLPHHRASLPGTFTSNYPAVIGRLSSFEANGHPTSNSKLQQQELVFRILCPNDRVGWVIGKGGNIIQAIQEESGASINVGLPVANCDERLITISSMEDVDSKYSPAQRAVVLVYSKSTEAAAERGLEANLNKGLVSARLVVPSNQVGCLLGKGGIIISDIRKATGARIHIHRGDKVPNCVPPDSEVVEISGEFVNTQDALYHVTSRLRNYLFTSKAMNLPGSGSGKLIFYTGIHGSVQDVTPGSHQFSGISQSNGAPRMGRQTFETGVNPRNFATASDNGRGELDRLAVVRNTAVEILVPENSISFIYGENGNNLTRIRQISGAKVTVHEAVPGIKNRTVVISGTPDETQAAQSLVHAFILAGSS